MLAHLHANNNTISQGMHVHCTQTVLCVMHTHAVHLTACIFHPCASSSCRDTNNNNNTFCMNEHTLKVKRSALLSLHTTGLHNKKKKNKMQQWGRRELYL